MAVPTLAQVLAAVERLSTLAAGTGAVPHAVDAERLARDCLRVVYRLVFADLAVRRGGKLDGQDAVSSLELELVAPGQLDESVLRELSALLAVPEPVNRADDPVIALGALHETVLLRRPAVEDGRLSLQVDEAGPGTGRKVAGAYFTPAPLVEWLLDQALEPTLDELAATAEVTVLDPSCGAGVFLVAATRRLRRRGFSAARAMACVAGVDLDPAAMELARVSLWLEGVEDGRAVAMPRLALSAGDALGGETDRIAGEQVDVVVGNPPFLNQLERLTAHRPGVAAGLNHRSRGALRPYTDVSAVFLQRAVDWVRTGGRIGLVQPQSVLAARDAAGVRGYVAATCGLEALWASDVPVFDARVLTCAPVLRKGAAQQAVRRFHGPSFDELEPRPDPELRDGWGYLVAAGLGIPEVALPPDNGVLADIADCTADFRDQYYGLAPYVHEAHDAPTANVARLVTSGLIDPAETLWGRRPTRFLKRTWAAPVIDLDALSQDARLHRWATRRLVPKVVVGTQGKVIEAVADEGGRWLPSVPTLTVVPRSADLWHVLAVLLAPPVAAHAAATFAGTALSMRAIKLSAKQLGQLPLPVDRSAWDLGAAALRRAQREPALRRQLLVEAAGHLCRAYPDGDRTLEWWVARLPDGTKSASAASSWRRPSEIGDGHGHHADRRRLGVPADAEPPDRPVRG